MRKKDGKEKRLQNTHTNELYIVYYNRLALWKSNGKTNTICAGESVALAKFCFTAISTEPFY